MKKTILVTLVAAMMLFAFTACDSNAGYQLPANVEYLTVEQTGDFLVGQTPDASKFDVYAVDTNGGKTLIPGAVVTISESGSTSGTAVKTFESGKTYIAKSTLSVSSSTKQTIDGSTLVKVYAIDSVEITGAPELAVYKATEAASGTAVVKADGSADSASDYANAKYAVVYNGTSKMELSADEFLALVKFEALVTVNVTNVVPGTAYPVYIRTTDENYVATNLTAEGVAEKPVVVTDPSVQTGLTATVSEKNYIGENTDVKIYATYNDKDPVQISDLSKYVIVETTNGNKVVTSIPATFDTVAHTYRVTDPTNSWNVTVQIPAGQNYYTYTESEGNVTSVTVAAATLANNATYKYGQEISGNNVTVTITPKDATKADSSDALKYPVADKIISVELVGVDHIPSKAALSDATSFSATCLVTYTSMGETKTASKTVTFNNLSE